MTIETKFNIGDEVWFKGYKDLPFVDRISNIYVNIGCDNRCHISYETWDFAVRMEEELFRTKQELLESL